MWTGLETELLHALDVGPGLVPDPFQDVAGLRDGQSATFDLALVVEEPVTGPALVSFEPDDGEVLQDAVSRELHRPP